MMLDEQQLQKLLRIKRFEHPPPGYFDRALIEFHRRQREELLRRSAALIWWERFVSGLGNFRVPSYAYGAAFGAFVVVATIIGSGLWAPYKDATDLSANRAVLSGPEAWEVAANRFALSGNIDWSTFDHTASSPKVLPVISTVSDRSTSLCFGWTTCKLQSFVQLLKAMLGLGSGRLT